MALSTLPEPAAAVPPPRPPWQAAAYAGLGPAFAAPVAPHPVGPARWLLRNAPLAAELGLDLYGPEAPGLLELLAGNAWRPQTPPQATVYSGHQFGAWAGQLGDGRALLLGEVATAAGPQEIQLKGAGPTPYSRRGDGRAVLRSSIREYLASEALHALGIPTTRALALVGSALPVRRETLETAAIVTRVAPSFLRFGHFEHFCHHGHHAELAELADWTIRRFFPAAQAAGQPVLAMLAEVSRRTAELLADWQAVGFCHGVMNSDNMSLLGLTLDYGPYGFLDRFDPGHICNHSDHQGRYAFARQPSIAGWNLQALATALLPLVGGGPSAREAEREAAVEGLLDAIETYRQTFPTALLHRLRAKLGLRTTQPEDAALADDWLALLAAERLDHTQSWRRLARLRSQPGEGTDPADPAGERWLRDHVIDRPRADAWLARYRARLQAEGSVDAERAARMRAVNPAIVLRNHLAQAAIAEAERGGLDELQRLAQVLTRPYDEPAAALAHYAEPPPADLPPLEVSCSS